MTRGSGRDDLSHADQQSVCPSFTLMSCHRALPSADRVITERLPLWASVSVMQKVPFPAAIIPQSRAKPVLAFNCSNPGFLRTFFAPFGRRSVLRKPAGTTALETLSMRSVSPRRCWATSISKRALTAVGGTVKTVAALNHSLVGHCSTAILGETVLTGSSSSPWNSAPS